RPLQHVLGDHGHRPDPAQRVQPSQSRPAGAGRDGGGGCLSGAAGSRLRHLPQVTPARSIKLRLLAKRGECVSNHSHSIVPGGLLVTSSTTRLISRTSLVIRVEMRSSTSYGTRAQSAVIASSLVTGRSTIGWP